MANVLEKSTMRYMKSVNTTDYMTPAYLINPDLSAVDGVSAKYWKLDGDSVLEMDAAEKQAVDDAEAAAAAVQKAARIDSEANRDELKAILKTIAKRTSTPIADIVADFKGFFDG